MHIHLTIIKKYAWAAYILLLLLSGLAYLIHNLMQAYDEGIALEAEKKRLDSLNIPKDENGAPYSIGNISGYHIQIPPGVSDSWITYNGDPNDFDFEAKRKYKRPPIDYDSKIAQFNFRFRLTDGALWRLGTQTDLDFEQDLQLKSTPWVKVIADADEKYPYIPQKTVMDNLFKSFSKPGSRPPLTYAGDEMAMEVYCYFGGKLPPPQNSWDKEEIYLYRHSNNQISTFIRCSNNPEFAENFCNHNFFMPDNQLKVFFSMSYPREFLPQWQHIETQAIQIVRGFVVPPASPLPSP